MSHRVDFTRHPINIEQTAEKFTEVIAVIYFTKVHFCQAQFQLDISVKSSRTEFSLKSDYFYHHPYPGGGEKFEWEKV